MNGWDFSILWDAGQAVLQGQDPYTVPHFFYPIHVAYIWAVFALLPTQVSFWIWISLNLGLLVLIFRKTFWQWLLYVPILHMMSSGQVDLFLWSLETGMQRSWRGVFWGAMITLKPQAALLLLPWHLLDWLYHDRKILLRWGMATILLWMAPLIWYPNWIAVWLNAAPSYTILSASNTPGLFSLLRLYPALWLALASIALVIFVWGQFQSKEIARAAAVFSSPLGLFYSVMALLGCAPAWILTPLSLLSAFLSLMTNTFIPFILLPLAVLGFQLWRRYRAVTLSDKECAGTNLFPSV